MASGSGKSSSRPPQSPSCSGNGSEEASDFECNICFELAQDPIVTLCGHLFCWPCLYKWLHYHSHSQECPVCKALIQQEKLVPLYGRGKTTTDPRSRSIPGIDIPDRPAGQRPETAPPPPPHGNHFSNYGLGFMGGFVPLASATFSNLALSGFIGGLFPSVNIQIHSFPGATVYGATSGVPHGFHGTFHEGHAHGFRQPVSQGRHTDNTLKNLFLMIGVLVILALLCY